MPSTYNMSGTSCCRQSISFLHLYGMCLMMDGQTWAIMGVTALLAGWHPPRHFPLSQEGSESRFKACSGFYPAQLPQRREMLTKQDYEAIAHIINGISQHPKTLYPLGKLIEDLCVYFAKDNPRFDQGRFKAACMREDAHAKTA